MTRMAPVTILCLSQLACGASKVQDEPPMKWVLDARAKAGKPVCITHLGRQLRDQLPKESRLQMLHWGEYIEVK
jgi:hypothetical protein